MNIQTFVYKVMSLLFNILSWFVIPFLTRSKRISHHISNLIIKIEQLRKCDIEVEIKKEIAVQKQTHETLVHESVKWWENGALAKTLLGK